MKVIYAILLVAVFVGAVLLFFNGQDLADFKSQFGRVSVRYNSFASIQYGKPVKVIRAVDGDTVQLENGDYLRYIGIDTPEEFDARKPVQCYAVEAAARNRQLVEGKEIVFYKDISAHDRYGRWLGFVYLLDGTFVNRQLVTEGYAFSYPYKPDNSLEPQFDKAQEQAKTAHLGLWSACQVFEESGGREQTNAVN
jgi:micrococcal nuclease